jgi:hypothetical protein
LFSPLAFLEVIVSYAFFTPDLTDPCFPADKRVSIAEYKIGRFQPDDNVGSSANLSDARRWLETCQKEHPKPCPGSEPSELPTRVINVGTNVENDVPRIEYSQSQKGLYVALSHCWGGKIDTLLTTKTKAAFLKALPLESLSANFRDAITTTRQLGIKYLWIDSLCILQDSKEDWENESRKMAAVYRDATLVLFAIAAAASTVGLLKLVRPSTGLPMRVFPTTDRERNDEVMLSACNAPLELESLRSLYSHGPLWSRAWTLQEGILSPRGLYFGNEGVYWKCNAAHEATTGVAYGNNVPESDFEELDIIIQDSAPNRLGAVRNRNMYSYNKPTDDNGRPSEWLLSEYYMLVSSYTRREITFGSDIFPAFSSLASTLHPNMGGEYVAGGWTADLRRSLLWHGDTSAGFCSHAKTGEEWRAPSWSWASASDPVVFGPYMSSSSWEDVYERVESGNEMDSEIKSYSVELADPQNPYGQIRTASLVIKARTIPVVRCDDILRYDMREHEDGRVGWDELITGTEVMDPTVVRVAAAFLQKADDASKCLLVAHTREGGEYINYSSDQRPKIEVKKRRSETYKAIIVSNEYGLVIAPVLGHPEGAWERKGYIELINLHPWADDSDDEEEDAKEDSQADSKGDFKGDSKEDSKKDSKQDSKGDFKGDPKKDSKKKLAIRFFRIIRLPFHFLRSWLGARKTSHKADLEGENEEEEEEVGEEQEEEERGEDDSREHGWPFETFVLV